MAGITGALVPGGGEIMNRHMGFPPDTRAGVVIAEAIPELAEELRLEPGSTVLDLACGHGAYGLLIARQAGTSLIGVDFSAQALTEAREQALRMGVSNASLRIGALTATGLPGASVEAVLCTSRASPALRSGTARRGWHASARCGKKPSRSTLARILRCGPSTRRA
jgi:SAM-dependent methyltransferase